MILRAQYSMERIHVITTWAMLAAVAVSPRVALCQQLIVTENVYAKTTRLAVPNPDENSLLAVAEDFLNESSGHAFRYLRASSFPPELSQQPALPLGEQSFERFMRRFDMLRRSKGCQLEVLGIERKAAARWSCTGGAHGMRLLQGDDPFALSAGAMIFVSMLQGSGLRFSMFQLYVLAKPADLAAGKSTIRKLIGIDAAIDWRLSIAEQPWLFRDYVYSPFNPNLLQYPVPERAPETGSMSINIRHDVRGKTIVVWKTPD